MRIRLMIMLALLAGSTGCITVGKSSDDDGSSTLNLGWLIGGFAMAVDGDDRDDHQHWFDDDDCECKRR